MAGATTVCEIYDPVANTWSPAAPLPYAATRLAAVLLPDGTVLAAGGYDFSNPGLATAFVNLYNPATNTWTPMTSLLQPRLDHTMTVLPNGQVLIVAGTDSNQTTNSVEIYIPTAGTNGQTQFGNYLIDDRLRISHGYTASQRWTFWLPGWLSGPALVRSHNGLPCFNSNLPEFHRNVVASPTDDYSPF